MRPRFKPPRRGALRPSGRRSGFEERVEARLAKLGVPVFYEKRTFSIKLHETGRQCDDCFGKRVFRKTEYTPDWTFANGNIMETKGRFDAKDRKIALAFRDQWREHKYHLLFMRNNTLTKASKTTYTDWCKKNGIECAVGEEVPSAWYS